MAEGHICLSFPIPRPQSGLAGFQGFPGHGKASHWLMDSVLGQRGSLTSLGPCGELPPSSGLLSLSSRPPGSRLPVINEHFPSLGPTLGD